LNKKRKSTIIGSGGVTGQTSFQSTKTLQNKTIKERRRGSYKVDLMRQTTANIAKLKEAFKMNQSSMRLKQAGGLEARLKEDEEIHEGFNVRDRKSSTSQQDGKAFREKFLDILAQAKKKFSSIDEMDVDIKFRNYYKNKKFFILINLLTGFSKSLEQIYLFLIFFATDSKTNIFSMVFFAFGTYFWLQTQTAYKLEILNHFLIAVFVA
jgi:hypothetical protein